MTNTSLTLQEVEYIAGLARLELTEPEKARYRQQLAAILEYIDQLQELDTTAILPTARVFDVHTPLRPDEPRPGLDRSELLANAPKVENEQFSVPPVLD